MTGLELERIWLKPLVNHPPAAMSESNSSSKGDRGSDASETSVSAKEGFALRRKKPYIFVYDLPPEYNARMLQYRVEK